MDKSFVEALADLRHISRKNFESYIPLFPPPKRVKEIIEELSSKVMTVADLPKQRDLDQLRELVYHNLDTYRDLDRLDKNSISLLPLLLKGEPDVYIKQKIIRKIKNEHFPSLLRNEILEYFLHYSNDVYFTQLADDIVRKLTNYEGKNSYFKLQREHIYLYKKDEIKKVVLSCANKGIFKFFDGVRLSKIVLSSEYVKMILKEMFCLETLLFSLERKIELFKEIQSGYKTIFPNEILFIIGKLIIEIEDCKDSRKELYKDNIKKDILGILGDPRLVTNDIRWNRINSKAKNIFLKWISQYDLELFFNIIDKGLFDPDAKRMWRYRKAFWESYKDVISTVWVCFGESAIYRVKSMNKSKQEKIFYGKYKSSDSEKSCILINIGDYTLVERSHTGSLKCFKRVESKFVVGQEIVEESVVNKANAVNKWNHGNSDTFKWQHEVGDFLDKFCHVPKQPNKW